MANNFKYSNNKNEYPVFSCIGKPDIEKLVAKMIMRLGNLSTILHTNTTEITFSEKVLIEIFERIEKRRIYFHVFYNGCEMGELNEGALLCFWIAKLQPFQHLNFDTAKLNAKIAVCIFVNSVIYYCKKIKQKINIPRHFVSELYYSLLYRDMSKESLMILAGSFVENIHG